MECRINVLPLMSLDSPRVPGWAPVSVLLACLSPSLALPRPVAVANRGISIMNVAEATCTRRNRVVVSLATGQRRGLRTSSLT